MKSYFLLKSVILILVIHINIILPSTSRSYKWFFPSGFPTETLNTFIFCPTRATHPAISPPPLYITRQPSIKCLFLRLSTLPKQGQTYFKRASLQYRQTDGQTYCMDLSTLQMAAIGPKRRYLFTKAHGVVCRKTIITGSNLEDSRTSGM